MSGTDKTSSTESSCTFVPIGIDATGDRQEFDSMGTFNVPAEHYWGAQTQRSLQHFSIGNDHMPIEVYRAYGLVKKACALVNAKAGRLEPWRAKPIISASERPSTENSTPSFRSTWGRPGRAPKAT